MSSICGFQGMRPARLAHARGPMGMTETRTPGPPHARSGPLPNETSPPASRQLSFASFIPQPLPGLPLILFFKIRHPPALPYRLQYSTIGRLRLNLRVRHGNGCLP